MTPFSAICQATDGITLVTLKAASMRTICAI
jgi:hypothetical protein